MGIAIFCICCTDFWVSAKCQLVRLFNKLSCKKWVMHNNLLIKVVLRKPIQIMCTIVMDYGI